jgi:hypothetical protein
MQANERCPPDVKNACLIVQCAAAFPMSSHGNTGCVISIYGRGKGGAVTQVTQRHGGRDRDHLREFSTIGIARNPQPHLFSEHHFRENEGGVQRGGLSPGRQPRKLVHEMKKARGEFRAFSAPNQGDVYLSKRSRLVFTNFPA